MKCNDVYRWEYRCVLESGHTGNHSDSHSGGVRWARARTALADPLADAESALEKGLRTAYAEGFKAGRLEASEMVREHALLFSGDFARKPLVSQDVAAILNTLAATMRTK